MLKRTFLESFTDLLIHTIALFCFNKISVYFIVFATYGNNHPYILCNFNTGTLNFLLIYCLWINKKKIINLHFNYNKRIEYFKLFFFFISYELDEIRSAWMFLSSPSLIFCWCSLGLVFCHWIFPLSNIGMAFVANIKPCKTR